MIAPVLENPFARDVRAGLSRAGQKTLPCRYFYDEVGSALFEAITCLPEYGLTRADARIIQSHAAEIASLVPSRPLVVELGSGSGIKTRALLDRIRPTAYCPIDVSAAALAMCARELSAVAPVVPIENNYLEGLRAAAAKREPGQALVVLFLGSTIGNFEPDDAADFLFRIGEELAAGDSLLLGTDLVKPVSQLIAAYDDPAGVTAAFNLNLLGRINRELGANFDLRRFEHVARYNGGAQRIEMHLLSMANQRVRIPEADFSAQFEAGETIHTESCHKFRLDQLSVLARAGGFRAIGQWTDQSWPFAETLLTR